MVLIASVSSAGSDEPAYLYILACAFASRIHKVEEGSDRKLDPALLHTSQGSHSLEKYLNIQDCLEKSLKIKCALKGTRKTLKGLEKSLSFTIYRRIQRCQEDSTLSMEILISIKL